MRYNKRSKFQHLFFFDMPYEQAILGFFQSYGAITLFLGAFFFGETVVLTAIFLAFRGAWSLEEVFWYSFFGTIVSDAMWFYFGTQISRFFDFVARKFFRREKAPDATRFITILDKIAGRRPYLVLLFVKFLYGTRILTILYLARKKLSFWYFSFFNICGTVVWLAVLFLFGYVAGEYILFFVPYLEKFQYSLSILIAVVLFFKFGTSWITNRIATINGKK